MPAYDPRPTDLALALECLDLSVLYFERAMRYRARAHAETDVRLEQAASALREERATCRLELAILHKLDVTGETILTAERRRGGVRHAKTDSLV